MKSITVVLIRYFFGHGGMYKILIAMVHEFLGQKRRDLIVAKCM